MEQNTDVAPSGKRFARAFGINPLQEDCGAKLLDHADGLLCLPVGAQVFDIGRRRFDQKTGRRPHTIVRTDNVGFACFALPTLVPSMVVSDDAVDEIRGELRHQNPDRLAPRIVDGAADERDGGSTGGWIALKVNEADTRGIELLLDATDDSCQMGVAIGP